VYGGPEQRGLFNCLDTDPGTCFIPYLPREPRKAEDFALVVVQAQTNFFGGGLQMTNLMDEPGHRVTQADVVQVS
jgi:hypothetical protein